VQTVMNTSQVTVSAPWQPQQSSTDLHGTFAFREAAHIFIPMQPCSPHHAKYFQLKSVISLHE